MKPCDYDHMPTHREPPRDWTVVGLLAWSAAFWGLIAAFVLTLEHAG